MFVVLHLYGVCSPGYRLLRDKLPLAPITPLIYQKLVTYPEADAIVDENMEAVGRGVKVQRAHPAC